MNKLLLRLFTIILLVLAGNASALPWYLINNCPGPVPVGYPTGTTVHAFGFLPYVCPSLPPPDPCITDPTVRIGGGTPASSGAILYSFGGTKVYRVKVNVYNLNTSEYLRVYLNGSLTPYPITAAEVTSYTTCNAFGSPAGLSFLSGGDFFGPACCPTGASSPYNGGELIFSDCKGISSIKLESFTTGSAGGGAEVTAYFDTTKMPGCSAAESNNPCEGDTLYLTNSNSVPGSTYFWIGPVGFTSTEQNPFIYPAHPLMSGTYRVYTTYGFVHDTDTVAVVVHPRAYIDARNNSPICENILDTLLLFGDNPPPGTGVAGQTYAWTGPNSFASTLKDPFILGFTALDSGWYFVRTNTPFGCGDYDSTRVVLKLPPLPPKIIGPSPYCFGDAFVPFTTTGVTPGNVVLWYTTTIGGIGSPTAPTINTSSAGSTKVFATQKDGLYCESTRDSITIVVKPEIKPSFTWNTVLGCLQDVVTFNNTSTGADWYGWEYGEDSPGDTTTDLVTSFAYKNHRVHKAVLHGYTVGCETKATGYVNTTHSIKAAFWPRHDTLCAGGLTTMDDSTTTMDDSSIVTVPKGDLNNLFGTSAVVDTTNVYTDPDNGTYLAAIYSWDFGDGQVDITNTRTPPAHRYDSGGTYYVKLTVTDSIGCTDTTVRRVDALRLIWHTFHDTMLCISQPLPLYNTLEKRPDLSNLQGSYVFNWTPSIHLDDTNIQNPNYTFKGEASTTYTMTATQPRFGCYAKDTVRIQSVVGVKLANVTHDLTIPYGKSVQFNSDSMKLYMWRDADGTLNNMNINNPVATPLATTTYAVYGFDKNGCRDTAYITVTVDSTMIEDVPSGFTPNGDGLNDIFRPVGLKYQNLVDFRVYNRLGTQVFYSNTYGKGWDGTFEGEKQDIGTYTYVIIVARPGGDGENVVHKGTVTLIR